MKSKETAPPLAGANKSDLVQKLAVGALLAICYFAHFFPFNIIVAIMWAPGWLYLLSIVLLIAVRIIINKWAGALNIAAIIYYILVSCYIILTGYYVWLLDPLYAGFVVLFAVVFGFVLFFFGDKRVSLLPFALVIAFFLFRLPHPLFKYGWIFFLPFILPGAILATPIKIGRTALIFAAVTALVVMRLGMFYYGGDEKLLPRVISQPGVTPVITIMDKSSGALSKIGKQIRYAADNMAGTHTIIGGDGATIVLDNKTMTGSIIMSGAGSDGLVYVPDLEKIVAGNYTTGELMVINDADLSIKMKIKSPGRAFTNLWFNNKTGDVITGDDKTRQIGVYNLKSGRFNRFIDAGASRDAIVDEKTGDFIATSLRRVKKINPRSGEVIKELRPPCSQLRLEIHSEKRRLYVSCFSKGELWLVNPDTFDVVDKLALEPGIRFLKLTEDKTTLFVSSYLKGAIFQIKVPELVIEKTIYTGPRVRSLHIAPGKNHLVFGSSLGVFRYRFR